MKRVSIRWLRGQTEFMGEVRNDAVRKKIKKKSCHQFQETEIRRTSRSEVVWQTDNHLLV